MERDLKELIVDVAKLSERVEESLTNNEIANIYFMFNSLYLVLAQRTKQRDLFKSENLDSRGKLSKEDVLERIRLENVVTSSILDVIQRVGNI